MCCVRLSAGHLHVAVALVVVAAVAYPIVIVGLPQPHPARRSVLASPATGRYTIYVANWGHHTSIIVPQPVAWQIGPANDPDAPFVEYAWGDRRYYMSTHPGVLEGLQALFLTGSSTTYLQAWRAPPNPADWRGLSVYTRAIDPSELLALVSVLEQSIDRSHSYPPVDGYSGRFYDGLRRYSWWYDCNRWTVAELARVDLAHGAAGVVFAGQVSRHLSGFTDMSR